MCDVANGLAYIHDQGMIHGDIKGVRTVNPVGSFSLTAFICQANILVDQTCHARLADFGLLTILSDSTTSGSQAMGGTVRWMSPELFDPEIPNCRRTKHSDCYAFGMVIYEVLSQHKPFYKYMEPIVYGMLSRGDRPERPEGAGGIWFTDDVWEVLERCWQAEPKNRPSIKDVLRCLEETLQSWVPPSPAQLLAIPSASDLFTLGSSDLTITSIGTGGVFSPPQAVIPLQVETLDQDEFTGAINGVR